MPMWILAIAVVLPLVVFMRSRRWEQLGLPTLHASSRGTLHNEELKCLNDEEEMAGASSCALAHGPSACTSAEAERDVQVACAAAHAILDVKTEEQKVNAQPPLDAQSSWDGNDEMGLQESNNREQCDTAVGSIGVAVDPGESEEDVTSKKSDPNEDIELPSYRLRESIAAFDSGELVDQLNFKMKPVERSAEQAAADSDSDDGGMSRPYLASNKHLAMSLD